MLTANEFNEIMSMTKKFEETSTIVIPDRGKKLNKSLYSPSTKDKFILNIDRGRINLKKVKYQARHENSNTLLLRIDTAGTVHFNPDGERIIGPHIHIYKEGFGDKWAFPLEKTIFTDVENLSNLLKDFLVYFNVENIPGIIYTETLI